MSEFDRFEVAPQQHLDTALAESYAMSARLFYGSLPGYPESSLEATATAYRSYKIPVFELNTRIRLHNPAEPTEVGKYLADIFDVACEIGHVGLVIPTTLEDDIATVEGFISSVDGGYEWNALTVGSGNLSEYEQTRRRRIQVTLGQHLLMVNRLFEGIDLDLNGPSKTTTNRKIIFYGLESSDDDQNPPTLIPITSGQVIQWPANIEPEWQEDEQPPTIYDEEKDAELPNSDPFDGLIGIEDQLVSIKRFAALLKAKPELLAKHDITPARAMILHGPSGTGKTHIARAVAKTLDAEIIEVRLSDVQGGLVGEWAMNIDKVFEEAMSSSKRVVIFMDELDGLGRNGNLASTDNISTVFKGRLEEIQRRGDVVWIGATNDISKIDPVVLADKRVPLKIEIKTPNQQQREELFRYYVSKAFGDDIDAYTQLLQTPGNVFAKFASDSEGFTGGVIKELVEGLCRRLVADALMNLDPDDDPDSITVEAMTIPSIMAAIEVARYNLR